MINIDKIKKVQRVISHGGSCPDGRASAMIVNNAFKSFLNKDIQIDFVIHNTKEHKELEPQPNMLFVDFSVHPDNVDEFLKAETIILDHHRGPELEDGTYLNKNVVQKFVDAGLGAFGDEEDDPGVCGALLAFEHVWKPLYLEWFESFKDKDSKDIAAKINKQTVETIKDFATLAGIRDTWLSKHPRFIEALEQGCALKFWPVEKLLSAPPNSWNELLSLGPVLYQKTQENVKKAIERSYSWSSKNGTRVCLLNGLSSVSEATEELGDKFDLVIGYDIFNEPNNYKNNDGLKLVCSTRTYTNFNCAGFAHYHGGSGHKKAAGFSIPMFIDTSPNPYKLIKDLLDNYEME